MEFQIPANLDVEEETDLGLGLECDRLSESCATHIELEGDSS
ncbi:unnamed protein product [Schistosoma curassoni]|uniref:Pheromone n=1 Tax=Schistosoma curassoni TaxID=6186 RepID=A0A183K1V8_9TREM|nr:unnamed protein product [Schistosoma curassoni]